jgi:hypothetical protein
MAPKGEADQVQPSFAIEGLGKPLGEPLPRLVGLDDGVDLLYSFEMPGSLPLGFATVRERERRYDGASETRGGSSRSEAGWSLIHSRILKASMLASTWGDGLRRVRRRA